MNQFLHCCALLVSTCAGLVSSIFCTPADVLKSRMMNQPYENGRGLHYKSTLDCLTQTVSLIIVMSSMLSKLPPPCECGLFLAKVANSRSVEV